MHKSEKGDKSAKYLQNFARSIPWAQSVNEVS